LAPAYGSCDNPEDMREPATLKLDAGEEVRVEVDREDLDHDAIIVHRAAAASRDRRQLLEVIDTHLADSAPSPAGTTDRLRQADRERPY
jgi:hypothetical protein